MSPGVEWEGLGESMTTNAGTDLMIQRETVIGLGEIFLNGHDQRDPLVAPLYGSYDGLPSLYIQVGGAETLLDDSTRLAANAARAGVEVRLDVFPHMQHVFQMAAGNMPEADDAITRIGDWLRPRLDL
jgi:monoterpene epsilon-lactone hydrolase